MTPHSLPPATALIQVDPSDGNPAPIARLIDRARSLACTSILLAGDGAATRRELLPWAARAASLGLDLALSTPARALAPERAAALLQLRLTRAWLPIDPSAPLPPSVTTLAGAIHLTLDVTLSTPAPDLSPLLAAAPAATLRLAPPPSNDLPAAAAALAAALAAARARFPTANLAWRGLPLCLLPGLEPLHSDHADQGLLLVAAESDPDFHPFPPVAAPLPPVCKNCTRSGRCPGPPADRALALAPLLRPTHGPRGNSFTYSPTHSLARPPDGSCPIYSSPAPYHPARHLLLDEGDHLTVHHTQTRDFPDAALAHTKRDLTQLYLDRSDKPAPDDFARDLSLLALVPACLRCDKVAACAGTYAPLEGDPFAPAEERLRSWLDRIATDGGRVIDVGCGDGRYADLWEPAARRGTLRYLGIEPETSRAAHLAARWPWAEIRPLSVEDLPPADLSPPLDALLVLRSWNHLADPARALAPLVAALRPGGLLLVADNLSFGLVRTAAQRHRAESSPALFEHQRDDDAPDALAALAPLPLDLLHQDPVTPGGANQWLLALTRRAT